MSGLILLTKLVTTLCEGAMLMLWSTAFLFSVLPNITPGHLQSETMNI